jgi:hypothetical protein
MEQSRAKISDHQNRVAARDVVRRGVLSALVIFALTGCGQRPVVEMPRVSEEDFLRASDILVAAQCELNRAAERTGAGFKFEKAVITMMLTVVVNESTGGGLTLAIPIAGSRITLDRSRRPIGSAIRRMDFQVTHDVKQPIDCPSETQIRTANGVRYIEGGLGLSEWFGETDTLVRNAGTAPSEINYWLGFDIALSTSLNPIISRSNGDGIRPDLSAENADDRRVAHRIAVTILPGPEGKGTEAERRAAARAFLLRSRRE